MSTRFWRPFSAVVTLGISSSDVVSCYKIQPVKKHKIGLCSKNVLRNSKKHSLDISSQDRKGEVVYGYFIVSRIRIEYWSYQREYSGDSTLPEYQVT